MLDRLRSKAPALAGSAVVLATVGAVGFWAKGAPAEVPLKIEAALPPKAENASTTPAAPMIAAPRRLVVHVAGEVRRPGVYELAPNARVEQALRLAGGPTDAGAAERLNLAATLRDGQKIVVPRRDAPLSLAPAPSEPAPPADAAAPLEEAPVAEAPIAAEEPADAEPAKPSLALASISLNAASPEELDRLPGVGPATATKIVAERERRGGFRAIEELLDVRGIGEAKLAKMRPYLTL